MSITSVKSGATGISLALDNNFMEPIATTLVGSGGSNNVTFSDIPQNYKHLQIRCMAKDTGAAGPQINFTCNSDNGVSYTRHRLIGNGSTVSASGNADLSYIPMLASAGLPSAASTYGVLIIDILDYTNTNKNKTIRVLSGQDSNGSGGVDFTSGMWMKTDAVSSITFTLSSGNFSQYSRFSLYGIKG